MVHAPVLHHRFKKRRYTGNDVRLIFGQKLVKIPGVKLRLDDGCSAEILHRMDADAETETVENRHDGKHFIALHQRMAGFEALNGQGVKIHIRKLNSLRETACSAGIENDRRIVRAAFSEGFAFIRFSYFDKIAPANGKTALLEFQFAAFGDVISHAQANRHGVRRRYGNDLFKAGFRKDMIDFI